MTDTDTGALTVGVVGLGGIGRVHAGNAVAAGHDVVGADPSSGARERFAAEFDATTHASHDALVAAGPDAVVVAAPNAAHEAPAVAALDAGVPTLVEKPLAHDLAAAERIAAAARASTAPAAVGFQHRFAPAVELVDAYRREGRFGDVRHVEATYVRRRGVPSLGSWFTDRERAGGGAVVDLGVHALDAALHCMGHPGIVEASAVTRSLFGADPGYADPDGWATMRGETDSREFDVEDSATAFLRCADGRSLVLEAAWALDRPDGSTVRLQGTTAGAAFDLLDEGVVVRDAARTGRDHYRDQRLETEAVDRRNALLAAFLRVAAGGEEPALATVEDALAVQRAVDAVYRSAEAGAAVRLDD
jgi:predicted dehydrogenase